MSQKARAFCQAPQSQGSELISSRVTWNTYTTAEAIHANSYLMAKFSPVTPTTHFEHRQSCCSPVDSSAVQDSQAFCLTPYRACAVCAVCTHGGSTPRPLPLSLCCQTGFLTPPPAEIRDPRGNHPACLTWHFLV